MKKSIVAMSDELYGCLETVAQRKGWSVEQLLLDVALSIEEQEQIRQKFFTPTVEVRTNSTPAAAPTIKEISPIEMLPA